MIEGTVHYDKTLTDLSIRFLESDFEGQLLGPKVAPLVTVDEQSGRYPVFGMEEFKYADDDDLLSDEGEARIYAPSMSADSYNCDLHAEQIIVSEYKRARSDRAFEVDAARRLPEVIRRMRWRHELKVASLLTTAGNYATNNKLDLDSLANRRWDESAPTPIEDIENAMDVMQLQCGVFPDTLIFPLAAWRKWKNLSDVRDAIKGDRGGAIVRQDVADHFGFRNVFIGAGLRDTAKKGQSRSMARLWGTKNVVLLYAGSGESNLQTPATAKTFVFNPPEIPTAQLGMVVGIERIPKRGGVPGSMSAEADWFYTVKATGVAGGKIIAGYLIYNVIA